MFLAGCASCAGSQQSGNTILVECAHDSECGALAGGAAGNGGASGANGSTGGTTGGDDGSGAGPTANTCNGVCCPSDNSCYSNALGKTAPGAECLATHDNTGLGRIQMAQTWVRASEPKGLTIPVVYRVLNGFTTLMDPACIEPVGQSGYIQAFDLDLDKGEARVGFSTYVTDTATAKSDGLCLAELGGPGWKDVEMYNGVLTDFSLPADQMSPSSDYPPGLDPPMPQPWTFSPTKAKRVAVDFDVTTDRNAILARFDKTSGDLALAGYSGLFYFEEQSGVLHSFAPLAWQLLYDPLKTGKITPDSFVLIPMRETEMKATLNDPAHPDCVGYLNQEKLDPSANCEMSYVDPLDPSWSGWPGVDGTPGEGSANTRGYFLITELEQIFVTFLQDTLCVAYPTASQTQTDGWSTSADKRCRSAANPKAWNPSDPVNGLPHGNWCAATNSPATANCHDAYRSLWFQAFQGFKIKDATCAPL